MQISFLQILRFNQLNLYTGLEQLFILHRMNRMRMYTGWFYLNLYSHKRSIRLA